MGTSIILNLLLRHGESVEPTVLIGRKFLYMPFCCLWSEFYFFSPFKFLFIYLYTYVFMQLFLYESIDSRSTIFFYPRSPQLSSKMRGFFLSANVKWQKN